MSSVFKPSIFVSLYANGIVFYQVFTFLIVIIDFIGDCKVACINGELFVPSSTTFIPPYPISITSVFISVPHRSTSNPQIPLRFL